MVQVPSVFIYITDTVILLFKYFTSQIRDAEGKSKLSEHVLKEGLEMKTIEETMSIIYLENNYRKINSLEEIEILKPASSKYLLNDVITGQNDPMYKLLQLSTPQARRQKKLQDPLKMLR